MKRKYELCLFDLDGVIIDSRSNMERSWSAVQSVFELDSPFEGYFQLIGRPFQNIMSVLELSHLLPEIKNIYDIASACRLDLINPYDGCINVIQEIKRVGIKTGIVTSKSEERTLEIVKKMDVLFDVIECPNEESRGKPHPDPILRSLVKCHTDPSETIYIGDMSVDCETAKRAGIEYIHAEWGYGKCDGDILRAETPKDILKYIL